MKLERVKLKKTDRIIWCTCDICVVGRLDLKLERVKLKPATEVLGVHDVCSRDGS